MLLRTKFIAATVTLHRFVAVNLFTALKNGHFKNRPPGLFQRNTVSDIFLAIDRVIHHLAISILLSTYPQMRLEGLKDSLQQKRQI